MRNKKKLIYLIKSIAPSLFHFRFGDVCLPRFRSHMKRAAPDRHQTGVSKMIKGFKRWFHSRTFLEATEEQTKSHFLKNKDIRKIRYHYGLMNDGREHGYLLFSKDCFRRWKRGTFHAMQSNWSTTRVSFQPTTLA